MNCKLLCRTLPVLVLPGILTLAAASFAEETVKSEEVQVTATRSLRELRDVPMSVSVMNAEDIEKSGARTVGELLEDVPGVQVQNDGSQGLKRVSIRGEDAFRTLVLIDGQKISEQKSMSGSPMLIDAARIERIEVIKGPASVLYGSDAIGGVVNIITKKGGEKPVEGDVWVGYSGASRGFSEGASLAGEQSGFKYRVSASHSDQGNISTPRGELDNTGFRQTDFGAFLSYDFSEHFTLGGAFDYFKGAYNSTSIEYVDDPDSDFFVKVPKWDRRKYSLFAEARDLSDYLARIRLDLFYQKTEKEMENYVASTASGSDVTVDNLADNFIRTKGLSLQTDWQLGVNNYLIAGYELNYDRLDSTGRTYMDSLVSMGAMSMRMDYHTDKYYDGTQLNQSLFASMETLLPWDLALTYGVRWTHVKTELTRGEEYRTGYRQMYMGGSAMGRPTTWNNALQNSVEPGEDSNSRPVFNVGLVWTGIDDLALRASWAQGFRVPNLSEKYVITSMGSTSGVQYGNPDLDPETSDNFEIGARWTRGPVDMDLAFFYSIADNYIDALPLAGSSDYRFENIAKARTFGSEFVFSHLFPSRYGLFTPYVSATWMRRQYDDGNGFKTYDTATPEWSGRYGIRYARTLNQEVDFHLDVYGRSQSATKYKSADGSADYELGGFTTANLALGFDFGSEKQYSVTAELLNIFDKTYQYNQAILEPGLHANLKFVYRF